MRHYNNNNNNNNNKRNKEIYFYYHDNNNIINFNSLVALCEAPMIAKKYVRSIAVQRYYKIFNHDLIRSERSSFCLKSSNISILLASTLLKPQFYWSLFVNKI